MPMATATDTEAMIDIAGAHGYALFARNSSRPARSATRPTTMRAPPRPRAEDAAEQVTVARYVYVADSRREAMDDLRAT